MNALFLTQSGSLRMFYELMKALRDPLQLDRVGFYVAHYPYFHQFRRREPDIDSGRYFLLKEWEITKQAGNGKPSLDLIRQYEQRLGIPHLWGPLVADRRIYLGEKCTFHQDYRPRFNHTEMLNILQAGLVSMERLFDQVQPDFIVSFICVTFGEYLAYLFAQSRGIPVLNLRPTRIKNYVTCGSSIFEPSERIRTAYLRYRAEEVEDKWIEQAREHIDFVQTEHALYEGVVVPDRKPHASRFLTYRLVGALGRVLRREYQYRFGEIRDNHDPGALIPLLYKRFLNPIRARWIHRRLLAGYVTEDDLLSLDYVFFPLHTEPEVTLLVYSKPHLNQIEAIRNISHSIPVGMTLVVKEHPIAVGKRPLSYYKKILDIPNVHLADPALASKSLVANAHLVATIAGSIGLEAILRQKPVVVLGHVPYEFLPSTMVRRVTDLERLGNEICDLLQNYEYQSEAATAYVAAVMSQSAPVNMYSTLLGRQGVYTGDWDATDSDDTTEKDVEALAQYIIESLEYC